MFGTRVLVDVMVQLVLSLLSFCSYGVSELFPLLNDPIPPPYPRPLCILPFFPNPYSSSPPPSISPSPPPHKTPSPILRPTQHPPYSSTHASYPPHSPGITHSCSPKPPALPYKLSRDPQKDIITHFPHPHHPFLVTHPPPRPRFSPVQSRPVLGSTSSTSSKRLAISLFSFSHPVCFLSLSHTHGTSLFRPVIHIFFLPVRQLFPSLSLSFPLSRAWLSLSISHRIYSSLSFRHMETDSKMKEAQVAVYGQGVEAGWGGWGGGRWILRYFD